MDLKNENSQSHILSSICEDLFSLASYLRESERLDRSDKLFNGILELFTTMEKRAREASIPEMDIQRAKHAIVALIDEGQQWASRLERKYFDSMIAGDVFFERLDEILKEARIAAKGYVPPYDVLEIYYICLTLGFGGRHVGDSVTIRDYIKKLLDILNIRDAEELAPHGKRPSEEAKKTRSKIPLLFVYAFIGVNIILVMLAIIFLKSDIINWATEISNRIRSFL